MTAVKYPSGGSKSHRQQTNDRVRGLRQGALSAGTTLFMMEEEIWCCFTMGHKKYFLYTHNTDHRLIPHHSSNKLSELLRKRHLLSSPIPWSILSTAIHFPLVPQERNYCCFAAAFQGEFIGRLICSKADVGLKLWCIRISPARRWDTHTWKG